MCYAAYVYTRLLLVALAWLTLVELESTHAACTLDLLHLYTLQSTASEQHLVGVTLSR
jgi:hypothetical protein